LRKVANRQTDRQTDRMTDRQTDKQRAALHNVLGGHNKTLSCYELRNTNTTGSLKILLGAVCQNRLHRNITRTASLC